MSEKRWSVGLGMLLLLAGLLVGCGGNNGQEIPPTASFTASPSRGEAPLTVVFDASGSSAAGGSEIVSYDWDFDDGTTGTGQVTTHTYETPGQYEVALEVTDAWGRTASAEETISVAADGNGANGSVSSFRLTGSHTPLAPFGGGQRIEASTITIEGKNLDATDHRDYYWRIEAELEFNIEGLWTAELRMVYTHNSDEQAVYMNVRGDVVDPDEEDIWYRLDETHDKELYSALVDAYGQRFEAMAEYILEYCLVGYSETVVMEGEEYIFEVDDITINDHIPDAQFSPPPGARVEKGWPEGGDDLPPLPAPTLGPEARAWYGEGQ